MSTLHRALSTCVAQLVLCGTSVLAATAAPSLTFSGDLRVRYEEDWDSHTASGTRRMDRERARARARLQAAAKLSDEWSFTTRIRTGNRDSQQSPHLTFWSSDDLEDDLEVAFDRYVFAFKEKSFTAAMGRTNLPFWHPIEMVWDEDVTPTGVSAGYETKIGTSTVTATAGAFAMPDGMVQLNGRLIGGQVKVLYPVSGYQLTSALSLYTLQGENDAEFLRNRNGARDYLIATTSFQLSGRVQQKLPYAVGCELIRNLESYNAADAAPFAISQSDEKSGFVVFASLGQLKSKADWTVAYSYARIETFAVNASFAQDDWARFGSSTQSDLTDIKGHEFRAAYAVSATVNVVARVFLVEAITTAQDGNRFRVDLNWKF
jgi:hypothetical protein